MSKVGSVRVSGVVLVARKGGEYWFVESVFRHDADFYGCTGAIVHPISEEQAKDALSVDQLADRFDDYWRECVKGSVKKDCLNCAYGPDEDGCEDCGYQSLHELCADIARCDGYDAVFDYPGGDHEEALARLPQLSGKVETIDCSGCGRIFHRDTRFDDFDEVYNQQALEACIAYEKGMIGYGLAARTIFNKSED